jgi:23S rRNA (uracil1939-C5)-methyltransferase
MLDLSVYLAAAQCDNGRVRIEKLIYGGAGLARVDGQVALTPFVLPGELVETSVVRTRKDMIEARVTRVVEASPERIEPPCPYFTKCGGCHYQHANYEYQLQQKREILKDSLQRVGRITPPEEIGIVSGPAWEYRNRAQFHFDNGKAGFLEAGSHTLVPIDRCPISSPKLNEALAALNKMAADRRFPDFLRSLEIFTNEEQVQVNVVETEGGRHTAKVFFEWCEQAIPGAVSGAIHYGGFRVSYGSFFQVNRFLVDQLVAEAVGTASGERALDLFAGVGLFSRALLKQFRKVTAVETGASACRDLEVNVGHAKVERIQAGMFLEDLKVTPDFVLADPPRAGLGKAVVKELARLKPPRIAIVSCDPATLARDLAGLLADGYEIEKMTMVDLFPQTYHLESVTQLKRR